MAGLSVACHEGGTLNVSERLTFDQMQARVFKLATNLLVAIMEINKTHR
jgi:hypothetical protein